MIPSFATLCEYVYLEGFLFLFTYPLYPQEGLASLVQPPWKIRRELEEGFSIIQDSAEGTAMLCAQEGQNWV